jgi:hypothetical protein
MEDKEVEKLGHEINQLLEDDPRLLLKFSQYRGLCLDELISRKPTSTKEIKEIIEKYNVLWNDACDDLIEDIELRKKLNNVFKICITHLICEAGILPENMQIDLRVWCIK